jgi:CrcB protein
MNKLLLIALGGAVGSVLRYLIAGWSQKLADESFPLGTMIVNVLGCLAIGALGAIFAGPHAVREEWRLALMIGLLGGFTTFSTFSYETLELANDGEFLRAGLNVVLTNVLCLGAAWISFRATEHVIGV